MVYFKEYPVYLKRAGNLPYGVENLPEGKQIPLRKGLDKLA